MSFLLPFEILTFSGWKQPTELREQADMVLCYNKARGFEYQIVRQVLVYSSNFSFFMYNNSIFSLAVCEGKHVYLNEDFGLTQEPSFRDKCKVVESEEYTPDPILQYKGTVADAENLQLLALKEGQQATLAYGEPGQACFQTTNSPFFSLGPVDYSVSSASSAVAVSCYENEATHFIARLAALDESGYKTSCVVI